MAELRKHGAEVLSADTGGRHGKVHYRHDGRVRFIVVALSGSDRRGPMNARQAVRHALGVVGGPKRIGHRRQHKQRIERPEPMPQKLTLGRDPFTPLYGTDLHRKALAVASDRAWNAWFAAHLRAAGHEPVHPALKSAAP